ncbi:MAG TPA: FAD-linked oxidase, partial [Solirubrobacteraceae bacterium]|nr:FAD-linked oxidase [Solirubrobacteraceae bacterium]
MSSSDSAAAPAGPVVRGPVVRPGDPGYDALRKVHNAMVDRRPGAIVRAADAADVACTVAHAAEHGVPLTVRAGGHS